MMSSTSPPQMDLFSRFNQQVVGDIKSLMRESREKCVIIVGPPRGGKDFLKDKYLKDSELAGANFFTEILGLSPGQKQG
ncbi:hypothetical protein [Metallosphaera javensis (ex Sakai et al. 2022)]|uniref:hypothetical protein n=1 Tax=Metallosphaera javensis (ex Sakai et al. 2022) TaxID=2775498 RepID=UPI0025861A5D|nr:MAG: hypothetical protein MjAS7_2352 [Metallosphaera javensis (ex Sakai et al. 2022)]